MTCVYFYDIDEYLGENKSEDYHTNYKENYQGQVQMCCIDEDYRKNAGLAGIFDLGTSSAMIVVIFTWLRGVTIFQEIVLPLLYLYSM